ncbi:MAG: hypothetical protein ABSC03_19615 [Verrucomicrobiota bacterium]|jgi:hypothetical protein
MPTSFLPVPGLVRIAVQDIDAAREARRQFYAVCDRARAADEWRCHLRTTSRAVDIRSAARILRQARTVAARNQWPWPEILAAAIERLVPGLTLRKGARPALVAVFGVPSKTSELSPSLARDAQRSGRGRPRSCA